MNLTKRPNLWTFHPVRRMTSLREDVDNLFNLAFGRVAGSSGELQGWVPAVDVYEDKDNLLVRAELPGMKKEDFEITLHEGVLTLSGERKAEKKEEGVETYRAERPLGRFHRSISLPCAVVADKIKATYHDGILAVSLPKAEEAKPKQIPISVQ